jgi:hypothetical protein
LLFLASPLAKPMAASYEKDVEMKPYIGIEAGIPPF